MMGRGGGGLRVLGAWVVDGGYGDGMGKGGGPGERDREPEERARQGGTGGGDRDGMGWWVRGGGGLEHPEGGGVDAGGARGRGPGGGVEGEGGEEGGPDGEGGRVQLEVLVEAARAAGAPIDDKLINSLVFFINFRLRSSLKC